MAETAQNNVDSLLGRLVIEQGLATRSEVEDCLALQRQLDQSGDVMDSGGSANGESDARQRSLADLLVANGIVTQRQIDRLRPQVDVAPQPHEIAGFKMLGRLGSGAMATVYKMKQLSLDRVVAVKVLPRKYMTNPQFVERFYAEGRAAARLNHPNIVQAIDVGKSGETHYFVMEYVEGRSVYDDIVEKGRYAEKEALKIATQIASALHHAHQAGLIHRDVKPKNIMLTNDGQAKLADMGLARAVSDREMAEAEQGKAYGTPYYISPEQIRGSLDVDYRADIYGFGATLYHMVTGQVPFDGPNPSAVMHKHLKAELVPPDHINRNLSAGIGEIIEVCMAKDPRKRYNSASDLLEDLEAVAADEPPIHARKKFDLAALSALESNSDTIIRPVEIEPEPSAMEQPIFWIAVLGWLAAVLLGIALVVILAGN